MTKKISQLPAATSVDTNDEFVINQDGTTKKLTTANPWQFSNVNIDGGNIDGTAIGVSSASSGAFTTLTASDDVNFDSGTLFVDASENRVGIGTTSPSYKLEVSTGSADIYENIRLYNRSSSNHTRWGINCNAGDNTKGDIQLFSGVSLSDNTLNFLNIGGGQPGSTNSGLSEIRFITTATPGTEGSATERMRIDSSGHAIIPAGVTLGTSAGVYNAANTLDDYETGTFTPTIVGLSTAGAGTYSVQNGKYTKIGNTVYFLIEFVYSNHTGTGNMQINGLPFTSSANVFPLMVRPDNLTLSSDSYCIFSVLSSSNSIQMAQTTTGTVSGALIPMDTAASIRVSGFYFV